MPIAHTRNQLGVQQDLVAHLRGVAELSAAFARDLGAERLGYLVGLWHDLGKFDPAFQAYLARCEAEPKARGRGPDHKAAGALLAVRSLAPLALVLQGHHGGLQTRNDLKGWLAERGSSPGVQEALRLARKTLADLEPAGRLEDPPHVAADPLAAELFLRLLFSALVDADSLDTERHTSPESAARRGGGGPDLATLWARFEQNQLVLTGHRVDEVGRVRHAVYQHCLERADDPPGLFRLAVPTGGGKTRSAMAFALQHALRHDLRRVIVAVPFITITEQTAGEYRKIFDRPDDPEPAVLEHHSAVVRDEADEDFHPTQLWGRLAAENWDAPIVVTTTVQLFESLFANRRSACRKLHRLARSVIILDEAQALPAHLLQPILDGLQQLCRYYGTTVVISTATQPAFSAIPSFAALPAREIVPDPARYFAVLKRVNYEWRTEAPLTWPEVAELLREKPQALAVVNTKKDALALLEALDDPAALHLSTLLCGAHRRAAIEEVKRRLNVGEPCRLVSTQVVEAGVDLDFPLVLRAMGPLDSLIQAAGRCNREGRLERGRVVVFQPAEGGLARGAYRAGTELTAAVLAGGEADPDDPAVPTRYFTQLFQTLNTDRAEIQQLRAGFDFPEVAHRFRMIDEPTESVAITSHGSLEERDRVCELLDRLRRQPAGRARRITRELQPYLVNIRATDAERYRRQGLIAPVLPELGEWMGEYDPVCGLRAEGLNLESLVG